MIRILVLTFITSNLFSQNSVVQQFSDSFADVAEQAKPAVVTIITDKIMKVPNNDLYFFFNHIWTQTVKENTKQMPWVWRYSRCKKWIYYYK